MGTFPVGTWCVLTLNQVWGLFVAQPGPDSLETLWQASFGCREPWLAHGPGGRPQLRGASQLDSVSQPDVLVTKPGAQGSPLTLGVPELMALCGCQDRS